MTLHQAIEFFTAINLVAIGLSHFLQPRIWADFFVLLASKGNAGNVFNAMLALGLGSFILSFHFIWSFPKVFITIYGLLQVVKGILYLIFPAVGLASIARVTPENAFKFRWVGLVMFIFGLAIFGMLIADGVFL